MFQRLNEHRHSLRIWAAAAFAFCFGIAAVVSVSTLMPTRSEAQGVADLTAAAEAANAAWWGALVAGTPAALDAVLAPEFQIVRADGSAYSRAGYLASSLPKVAAMPEFRDVVVTADGDHLVVRYRARVSQTRDGVAVQADAPRLSVFRNDGGRWLLVAHANFAALEQ